MIIMIEKENTSLKKRQFVGKNNTSFKLWHSKIGNKSGTDLNNTTSPICGSLDNMILETLHFSGGIHIWRPGTSWVTGSIWAQITEQITEERWYSQQQCQRKHDAWEYESDPIHPMSFALCKTACSRKTRSVWNRRSRSTFITIIFFRWIINTRTCVWVDRPIMDKLIKRWYYATVIMIREMLEN